LKPLAAPLLVLCAATICATVVAAQRTLPPSQLGVREEGVTTPIWRSDASPTLWTSAPLAARVHWRRAADGVSTGELQLSGTGEAWRTRLVVVRLDVTRLSFSLDTAWTRSAAPNWKIARAPRDALFAMNAGQFRTAFPWGHVVLNGRQLFPPARGPLAMTLAVDSAGSVHWVHDGAPMPSGVAWAFQSYPVILREHEVPAALRAPDRGIDVAHRDARLALGLLPDGALLVALTRFEGLGKTLESVPFGLTAPEMAAVMGALGASDAVLLDGGISAQVVAGQGAARIALLGWRAVPLAFIAHARKQ
jgi:hypothetical protein